MNVKELRELLAHYPDDMPVMVDGYEGGLCDLDADRIESAPVFTNVNRESYYGAHEKARPGETGWNVKALILHR